MLLKSGETSHWHFRKVWNMRHLRNYIHYRLICIIESQGDITGHKTRRKNETFSNTYNDFFSLNKNIRETRTKKKNELISYKLTQNLKLRPLDMYLLLEIARYTLLDLKNRITFR